ncbi:MAG TPA: selenocysteine-specific translation elongation factor [Syntrophales bacterium]|nr:selenocysteine-specific translation elongation factor [Syntrophales bacterium]HPQ44198.1 selenocysteine-specific translation elongation factor [Syntrophales bacterium]
MEKHITIGIAGHVDHGKTALVRCLTNVDTDRLREEKRRGLSIESGVAQLILPSRKHIALIDVPGHVDFLKNAIRGLSVVDMAILVVAADDGVMPQTREHLDILDLFGVKGGFVVLNKADLVDNSIIELAELEIRDAVCGTFLEGKPIVSFSAVDRRGLADVQRNIEMESEILAGKNLAAPFRLWIDQVRGFPGFGTVATGTIVSGTVERDDILHLLPLEQETRVRFLEVHHRKVQQAVAGERVGINLRDISLKGVSRGMALAEPKSVRPGYLLNAGVRVLKNASQALKNRQKVKLYIGTSVTNALVVIMEKNQLEPGENGLVQFRLTNHVSALPGDPLVVCLLNIQTVIGGGHVLEISREKYRQVKAPVTLPYLRALQEQNFERIIEHFFNNNPGRLIASGELARHTGLPDATLVAKLEAGVKNGELLYFEGKGFFGTTHYRILKKQLPEIVEKILLQNPFKVVANHEEIKNRLASFLDEAPFQGMLAELCTEGKLIKSGGGFQIRNLLVKIPDEQEKLIALLLDYARDSGFVPFSADIFCEIQRGVFSKKEVQRLLDYLYAQKRLIRLNNGRFLSPQAIEEIKERVRDIVERKGILSIVDSKEFLGYGRTIAISVLEYLDTIRFTRRVEGGRVLKS